MPTAPAPVQPNLFGSASDEDLQNLIAQLSQAATQEELSANGIHLMNSANLQHYGAGNAIADQTDEDLNTIQPWKGWTSANTRNIAMHASGSEAIGTAVRYYKGLKSSKKANAKLHAQLAAQQSAYDDYGKQRTAALESAKREMQLRETKKKVNGYFASDKMEGLYDSLRSNVLQNALSDIVTKYQGQLRDSAFQTAGQGLTGSSVDAERRGDIDKSQNAEAIGAAGNADRYASGVRDQNEQQRRQLIDTLSSGNPGDAAALEQSQRNVMNNTEALNQQAASQAQHAQVDQYGLNMQSQAVGNLLSNYANLYNSGQQARAYGGSGSAF